MLIYLFSRLFIRNYANVAVQQLSPLTLHVEATDEVTGLEKWLRSHFILCLSRDGSAQITHTKKKRWMTLHTGNPS